MLRNIALLIVAMTSLLACSTTPPPANNNSNIQGAAASPASTPNGDSESTATPTPVVRPDEASGSAATFEGTAGITEKKNTQLKESAIAAHVRSARHEGFDRVVFEFLGDQLPTYKIEYIDRPVRACGSGNVVPFVGDGWLSVRFTGAQAHSPEGDATIPAKDRTQSPNLPIVKDLKMICDFEGEVEWVMGVASPNKYRLLELKDPMRLVIDIRH